MNTMMCYFQILLNFVFNAGSKEMLDLIRIIRHYMEYISEILLH